jgi:hypothetical protein
VSYATLRGKRRLTKCPLPGIQAFCDVAEQITAEMTRAIVPVKIPLNQNHTFRSIELTGQMQGKRDPMQLQVGFERRGPAAASDFPATPKPEETTVLPDDKARIDLWNKITSGGAQK